MTKRTLPIPLLLILLAAAALACNYADRLLTETTPAASTAAVDTSATSEPGPEQPQPESTSAPTEPPAPKATAPGTEATSIPDPATEPAATEPAINPNLDPDQQASFDRLAAAEPPERDDLEVARLYGGWDGQLDAPAAGAEPLAVGAVQPFRILNHDDITYSSGLFVLQAISEHAYFWFSDQTPASMLSDAVLQETGQTFDQIYEQSVAIFGPENKPGVDGDPRLHIVNATPGQLCTPPETCGLAGYFSGDDVLPAAVDPDSNAHEMFVMNGEYFGGDFYLNVLTHELRHMIEDNTDRGDAAWEGEGSAMLAEDLLGYPDNAVGRANRFLAQPDQQLNAWTDGDSIPYYGQGYLLNRYIYDRLGPDGYRHFAASPATGLLAIDQVTTGDQVTAGDDPPLTGHQLWLDWLATLALIDNDGAPDTAPDTYRLGVQGLDSPAMQNVERFPADYDETVHQYAVDYYRLSGADELEIEFAGSQSVPMLDTQPFSGESMWLANRANNSHVRLTRPLDLMGVSEASLEYSVYHDIESGYDFAYVFVSEDDGRSWQPLVASNMQGPESDPSDSALAASFYTGRSEEWRRERIDLSPYAGQEILIRFAYLTDMVLTFGGIALDDIAVPEIGFFDDAETPVDGWTAEGFDRLTAAIPQQWDLQLITFPDGRPQIQPLPLAADQTLSHTLNLTEAGDQAILIISAWAPMTLQTAAYHLSVQTP